MKFNNFADSIDAESPQTREFAPPDRTETGARYLQFVAKTARLTEDQIVTLANKSRELDRIRAKARAPERITDNTLIRLCIDYTFKKAGDKLKGTSEEQLRRSVGL